MSAEPDRALDALARNQHGVFQRAQAQALGFTSRMVERRVASGAWLRLDRGLYALASHPFSWLRQAKAAELSIPGGVISHRSAAVLHRLDGYKPGHLDLTVPERGSSRSRLATVHRRRAFDVVVRQGIRTTTVPRLVVDLAAVLGDAELGRLLDDVVVQGHCRLDEIRSEFDRVADGHPAGAGAVRRLLELRVDGAVPSANMLEDALESVLSDPSLPPHQSQAGFPWLGAYGRVDVCIPSWRRIIEADGRRWHSRQADFERDQARDHQAQRHGYEVTHFTYDHLVRHPDYALEVLLAIGAHTVRHE